MSDNYVNSSLQRIRRRLRPNSTIEETKEVAMNAVNLGVEDFLQRLERKEIQIDNVADLERLVKMGILINGESNEGIIESNALSEEEASELEESEEYKALVASLEDRMNDRNEES